MSPGLVNSRLVHRSGQKQTCPQVLSGADLSTGRPVLRTGQKQTCPQVWSGSDPSDTNLNMCGIQQLRLKL
ncbi:Hypothetical predicted protein, partial [Mytilus galloprovincialis]